MKGGNVQKGLASYFTTDRGRKVVFGAACTTGMGLFLVNYLPHTFGIKYYREFFQCYKHGVERDVSEKVMQRLEKAFEKLNVSAFDRRLIKVFTAYGFDVVVAGTTKSRFGGIIGIPANFYHDSFESVDKQEIRFRNELIEWNSEGGRLLQESIVLTEDEQIFAICKSILQLQTHRVLLNSLFPTVSFLSVYTIGSALNFKLGLLSRPFGLRMILYTILGLFGLGIWSFLKDFNQVRYDADIDKALCELGPDFIDAGIRYYDKVLKKNMALRALLGDNTYTAKGNENYLLRQKSLPLTLRKSYFEMRMEELKKKLEESKAEAMAQ